MTLILVDVAKSGFQWTYEKFNKDEMSDMFSTCEIQEKDREKAEQMVKVALWCVQYFPKARPMMSLVVKWLEGGIEIDTPPNPFEHLQYMEHGSKDYSNGSTTIETSNESLPPLIAWNHSMEPTNPTMWVSLENMGREQIPCEVKCILDSGH